MKTRLPIFKAGKHRAMNGKVYEFSDADLTQIVQAYDPHLSQAPHVVGHPKTDDPAWGWVKSIGIDEDGLLYSEQEQVDPAFAEIIDAGRYKTRSAAFYAPNDPANPKPGGYYLRHVGWLGAVAPSVKGLGPAFSEEAGDDLIEFADGLADGFWVKDILRGLRDWMIDKFSLDEANKVIPAWAIDNVERSDKPAFADVQGPADQTDPPADPAPEPEPAADAAFAERQAQLDAREAAIAAREAATGADQVAFAQAARTAARGEDTTFVDDLVLAGKLPPGHADQVKTLLGVLDGDEQISFAQGEDGPRDQLRALLSGLGTTIVFAEVAAQDGARFAEGQTPEGVAAQIREIQAEAAQRGEPLSASQAVARIGR